MRYQIVLVLFIMLGLTGAGCLFQHHTEIFDWGQYSEIPLPLSTDAQKARSLAVSYLDQEDKRDTSEFTVRVLQDSLSYAVECSPKRPSLFDSAGKMWVFHDTGYEVIIRKSDFSIIKVWVIR